MSIYIQSRKAGPYTADGKQTAFSFAFKVFRASDVLVYTALADSFKDAAEQVDQGQYSVSLNEDQDTSPGGTVTFSAAPDAGTPVTILSGIPETQPMGLTNRGGFYPETLNDSADRAVALIQQLSEKVDRAVKIPETSTGSPEELTQKLLDAADDAAAVAKGYAESAKASAEAAEASASAAAQSAEAAAAEISKVEAAGDAQVERVTEATDEQIKRIESAGDSEIFAQGLSCLEQVWTLSADVAAGETITLPEGMQYMVGRHHLQVSWNGIRLYPGSQFAEVGDGDTMSSQIKTLMPMSAGDELDAWVSILGYGAPATEALTVAYEAQSAVADLSRRVVYKDEDSASGS